MKTGHVEIGRIEDSFIDTFPKNLVHSGISEKTQYQGIS